MNYSHSTNRVVLTLPLVLGVLFPYMIGYGVYGVFGNPKMHSPPWPFEISILEHLFVLPPFVVHWMIMRIYVRKKVAGSVLINVGLVMMGGIMVVSVPFYAKVYYGMLMPGGAQAAIGIIMFPFVGLLGLGFGAIVGAGIWRPLSKGRIEAGVVACSRCGYDLRGNESGTCPECGKVIQKSG